MGQPELNPSVKAVPGEVPESEVEDAPATVCCCGHPAEYHLGGPELAGEDLLSLHMAYPGGDGGMCRVPVAAGRCDCFNFCNCHTTL